MVEVGTVKIKASVLDGKGLDVSPVMSVTYSVVYTVERGMPAVKELPS